MSAHRAERELSRTGRRCPMVQRRASEGEGRLGRRPLPGELLTEPVLRYLRTGIEAGMKVPDAVVTQLNAVRVRKER